jgi:hypothetical protein
LGDEVGITDTGLANLDDRFANDLCCRISAIDTASRESGFLIGRDQPRDILGLQRCPSY